MLLQVLINARDILLGVTDLCMACVFWPSYSGCWLRNTTKEEMKALNNLKKGKSRVVMKADKGNCLVVMDRPKYDEKMESMLSDRDTYEIVNKPLFGKVERELKTQLLRLNNEQKLDFHTYMKLHVLLTAHHLHYRFN